MDEQEMKKTRIVKVKQDQFYKVQAVNLEINEESKNGNPPLNPSRPPLPDIKTIKALRRTLFTE